MNTHDDNKAARRMGQRLATSILLPPYLAANDYYVQMADAIDETFGPMIDSKLAIMRNLRNMWVTEPGTEEKIASGQMLVQSDWPIFERELLVRQANMLGMKLTNSSILSDQSYQQLNRHVGTYWFGKGTDAFIEFMNFCMGTDLVVHQLWTQNYKDFVEESVAGTPVWEGGTWYSTTHVEIRAGGGLDASIDLATLVQFFYEIANYNLVLASVDNYFEIPVVGEPTKLTVGADIVAIGVWAENSLVISNEFRYGVAAPPSWVMNFIPTRYYGNQVLNPASGFLLGMPSAWIVDDEGRKFPVYGTMDQTMTSSSLLPITSIGTQAVDDVYHLLASTDAWVEVPGSSRSQARIPAYTTAPTQRSSAYTTLRLVGNRSSYLSNPLGFVELTPGNYSPYW